LEEVDYGVRAFACGGSDIARIEGDRAVVFLRDDLAEVTQTMPTLSEMLHKRARYGADLLQFQFNMYCG